jgi:hypothetical protein
MQFAERLSFSGHRMPFCPGSVRAVWHALFDETSQETSSTPSMNNKQAQIDITSAYQCLRHESVLLRRSFQRQVNVAGTFWLSSIHLQEGMDCTLPSRRGNLKKTWCTLLIQYLCKWLTNAAGGAQSALLGKAIQLRSS